MQETNFGKIFFFTPKSGSEESITHGDNHELTFLQLVGTNSVREFLKKLQIILLE
jgi:hypothetical protein